MMNRAMTIILTHTACLVKNETDDYNSQQGITCSQSIVGDLSRFSRELHLTKLFKL